MSKRTNGEGALYFETERKRWVGQLIVNGRRHKVTARTKVDASAKLAALRAQSDSGQVITNGQTSVSDLFDLWEGRVLAGQDLAPRTRERIVWMGKLIRAEIGTKRLRDLDVDSVERMLDRLAAGEHGGRSFSRSSCSRVRSALSRVLDFAIRRKLITINVAKLAELPGDARRPRERAVLDAEQAAQMWQACEGERLGALFRLMLMVGLRPGEASGVLWDDLDLEAGTLTVGHAVRVTGGRAELVDELKTSASYRTVGLPTPIVAVLTEQRKAVALQQLAARSWADPRLVFPTTNGTPWNPKNLRNELAGVIKRYNASLPEDAEPLPVIAPNELRHSAATVMNDHGVALELIADVLGHKNTRMLGQTYRHRVRPVANAAVGVMDSIAR